MRRKSQPKQMYNDSSSGYYTADDDPLIEEVRIYNTILLWKFYFVEPGIVKLCRAYILYVHIAVM